MSIRLSAGFGTIAIACLLAASWLAPPSRSATASASPRQLYERLRSTPIAPPLPSGLSSPKIGWRPPSALAKSHGAVGHAEIDFNGGYPRLVFLVFATRAGAVAEWNDSGVKAVFKNPAPAPTGFPRPAILGNYTTDGIKVSSLAFVWKNVIVSAVTGPRSSPTKVDSAASIRLGRLGLKHLQAVIK